MRKNSPFFFVSIPSPIDKSADSRPLLGRCGPFRACVMRAAAQVRTVPFRLRVWRMLANPYRTAARRTSDVPGKAARGSSCRRGAI